MGDVIKFHRPQRPLEAARDLLAGIAESLESIPIESASGRYVRDVMAERAAEAHDILQDHIETLEGK